MSLPVVAIVGQPNVGKSSLFNRFLRKPLAVVSPEPGVTRDRNYAECEWNGRRFYLVDTGGIVPVKPDEMEKLITVQSEFAIEEADLVLFVVDSQLGVDTIDKRLARELQAFGKPCILVANKADTEVGDLNTHEALRLGMGEAMAVSATGGRNIGDLLDLIIEKLPPKQPDEDDGESTIRVALVGRPNVGKSSFINKLLNENRLIVSPIAGTTRDAVDTPFEIERQKFVLIDTAGLRRRYRVSESIEFYTTLRTERAIENCDVAIVLIDAVDGLTTQDQRVLDDVLKKRRGAVLAVNKWDLVEKDGKTAQEFTKAIEGILAKYAYLPIIYVSAKSGQRISKTLTLVKEVAEQTKRRISTSEMNQFLGKVVARKHPPAVGGKHIKFTYMTQSETNPPTFIIFANHPEFIDKSYVSYLQNQIREVFGFAGVPFRLKFRKK